MTLSVATVLSVTDDLLLDASRVRWTVAERIRYMNEAMGAILNRKPSALQKRSVVTLVAGTRQSIPSDGSVLLDVVRNFASDGTTAGRAIRRTDRQLLDDTDPDWHTTRAKTAIKHFTFDDRAPKDFYCYPPAVAGIKAEVIYAALPTPLAEDASTGQLEIGAEYQEAVVNYVAYRCNSKDSEFAAPAIANAFYQAFEAALGMKAGADMAASPNQPGNSV